MLLPRNIPRIAGNPSELRVPFADTKKPAGIAGGSIFRCVGRGLAESGQPPGQARKLSRGGILVKHALRNAAGQFRLNALQRSAGTVLVAGSEGRFDLLYERADAADSGAIDLGAAGVAADTFLCLRRVRHLRASSSEMKRARPGRTRSTAPSK